MKFKVGMTVRIKRHSHIPREFWGLKTTVVDTFSRFKSVRVETKNHQHDWFSEKYLTTAHKTIQEL